MSPGIRRLRGRQTVHRPERMRTGSVDLFLRTTHYASIHSIYPTRMIPCFLLRPACAPTGGASTWTDPSSASATTATRCPGLACRASTSTSAWKILSCASEEGAATPRADTSANASQVIADDRLAMADNEHDNLNLSGFTHSADGAFCMDENECASQSHHVCQHGRCVNTEGAFRHTI